MAKGKVVYESKLENLRENEKIQATYLGVTIE
jgi:ABC-type uncharacterized transport system ATPase subunit